LPERGEARLIALETTAPPALLEVQRRLARRLAANRGRGSRSPFLPHMTLARFGGSGGGRVEASVPPDAFFITELLLMQSVLLPDGACHSQIAAFPLQPAP
jgi:2'-5' RNA ligase